MRIQQPLPSRHQQDSLPCSTRSVVTTTRSIIIIVVMTMVMRTMVVVVALTSPTIIIQRPLSLSLRYHPPAPQRIASLVYNERHRPFLKSSSWQYSSSTTFPSKGHCRYMASNSNGPSDKTVLDWNSNDPYTILGISRNTIINEKELKRRYRQLAMKYHPDMTTTRTSTASEKQTAADQFTKINQAYHTILNQIQGKSTTTQASSSSSSSGSSGSTWEPPHRRTRSYTSTSTSSSSTSNTDNGFGVSTDWRDYIPKTDNDEIVYDTNGDSFGKIFSDFLQGTASTVIGATTSNKSGGGGIFNDFIDFLEQNVDGYSRRRSDSNMNDVDDDSELRILLQMGSKEDIANEMEESELVVQQLTNKLQKVQEEIVQIQNEISMNDSISTTTSSSSNINNPPKKKKYSEILELQERNEELQSQLRIVERYLQRARSRYTKIQIRYKEILLSTNNNNNNYGTARTTSTTGPTTTSTPSSSEQYKTNSNNNNNPSSSSSSSSSTTATKATTEAATNDSLDGFQTSFSNSRGRGSSRRRSGTTATTTSSSPSVSDQPPPPQSPPSSSRNSSTRATTTSESFASSQRQEQQWDSLKTRLTSDDYDVPPHRRTSTTTTTTSNNNKSFAQKMEEDKQRLREIKVDEAFDQLKRDLGL